MASSTSKSICVQNVQQKTDYSERYVLLIHCFCITKTLSTSAQLPQNRISYKQIPKSGDIMTDIDPYVLLLSIRGSSWNKISKITEKQWLDVSYYKNKVFHVLFKTPPNGYGKDDIIIARIAAVVLHWVTYVVNTRWGRIAMDTSIFERIYGSPFSKCLFSHMFPKSCIKPLH